MERLLLAPPVAFIIILVASLGISSLFSRLAFKPEKHSAGERESYAGGEKKYDHMAHPDYSIFFPFAFFFTLAHVATLIATTFPAWTTHALVMGAIYISGAAVGLYILFRK